MCRKAMSAGLLLLAAFAGCQTPAWKNESVANIDPSVPQPIDVARPSADYAPHIVTTPPTTGRYQPHLLDPVYGGSTSGHCSTGIRGSGRS